MNIIYENWPTILPFIALIFYTFVYPQISNKLPNPAQELLEHFLLKLMRQAEVEKVGFNGSDKKSFVIQAIGNEMSGKSRKIQSYVYSDKVSILIDKLHKDHIKKGTL